jgi:pSer/pThr/pTyr-binding forkhead associated (FHA) protein
MAAVAELDWKEHESNTGLYDKLRQIERKQPGAADVTRIEVRSDGELLQELTFPRGRVIIGRSPDNEIYIKSKFVSRHHAQLVSDDQGCIIEDLNSTNGIFIDEKQIKKRRLSDGDIVTLGVHELVYYDLRNEDEKLEDQIEDDPEELEEDQESESDEDSDAEDVAEEQETA